jgi:SAM-dependent methyltransferase
MSLGKIYNVDKDATELKMEEQYIKLDLACGNNCKPGFVGVDISPDTQAQIICDLEDIRWMFLPKNNIDVDEFKKKYNLCEDFTLPDNSVGEIFSSHYIEHITDLKSFMEEIYRIVIPGGLVTFIAPYYSSVRAMQDFTHKRFISENTFLYWNQEWLKANGLLHYEVNCNFNIVTIKHYYTPEWQNRAEAAKEYAKKYYINVIMDIEVTLQAIK